MSSRSHEAVPVSLGEPFRGNYLLIDSNQPGTVRSASGGVDKIVFPSSSLSAPYGTISKISLRSFVFGSDTYNIMDYSAYHSLQNNLITLNATQLVIPPGTYNATNLSSTLQALFDTVVPGFTVVYDSITLTMGITHAVPFSITFGTGSPAYEMGFADNTTYGPATSIASPYAINLSGPYNVLIHILEIQTYNLISCNNSTFHFMFPLTSATPAVSQGNVVTLGKLDCYVTNQQLLSQLTVRLGFTRAGVVYQMIGDANTNYQMLLQLS